MLTFTQFLLNLVNQMNFPKIFTVMVHKVDTNIAWKSIGLKPMVTVVLLQLSIQLKDILVKVVMLVVVKNLTSTTVNQHST